MSRGAGRIEIWIAGHIGEIDCVVIGSSSLAEEFRPSEGWDEAWKPSRAQRKSVVRAMHSFVRKHPEYALMGGQGRKDLYLYEVADPTSVTYAKACVAIKGEVYAPFGRRVKR